MINSFQGNYRFLSNFWPCKVTFEGLEYPSTECAYQAAKTDNQDLRKPFTQMSAGSSKRFGRTLTIRKDWKQVKIGVMESLLIEKFKDDELKQKLLSTGTQELIEGNTWGDTFWGVCNGHGSNHLGKLLMKVREQLNNNP